MAFSSVSAYRFWLTLSRTLPISESGGDVWVTSVSAPVRSGGWGSASTSMAPPVTSMPRPRSACSNAPAMKSVGFSTDTVCVRSVLPAGTEPVTPSVPLPGRLETLMSAAPSAAAVVTAAWMVIPLPPGVAATATGSPGAAPGAKLSRTTFSWNARPPTGVA